VVLAWRLLEAANFRNPLWGGGRPLLESLIEAETMLGLQRQRQLIFG
jgi:hypothetical protein